jgi:hypothetical protein
MKGSKLKLILTSRTQETPMGLMKNLTLEFLHTFIENLHLTTSIVENLFSKNSIQKTITRKLLEKSLFAKTAI